MAKNPRDVRSRIHHLHLFGNSDTGFQGVGNDANLNIGNGVPQRGFSAVMQEDILPTWDLGARGRPLLNHLFGVLYNREMWFSMNLRRPLPSWFDLADLKQSLIYGIGRYAAPMLAYVGYPAAHEDPFFEECFSLPERDPKSFMGPVLAAFDPAGNNPRKREFFKRCDACAKVLTDMGCRLVLDTCTGVPPRIIRFPEAWEWWAEWAILKGAKVVFGIEPHYVATPQTKYTRLLQQFAAFSTLTNFELVASGHADSWAKPIRSCDPDKIHILVAGSSRGLGEVPSADDKYPSGVTQTGEPVGLRAHLEWSLRQGFHVYSNFEWFRKTRTDIVDWIFQGGDVPS